MNYELRPYQATAISKLRESFASGHRRPLLQASTGAGKTMIAVDIINSALDKGKKVMFIIDRLTLIDQTSAVFDKFGLDHGIHQGDHWRRNDSLLLQLVSVQTLVRRKYIKKPDLLIVDEAHSVYKSFIELIQGPWSEVPCVALSATPWTVGLAKIYDDLVVVESTQNLINQGYLSNFDCWGPESGVNMKGVKTVAGDYNNKEMGERFNKPKITASVVDTWLKLGDNRQTICFCVNVAHSKSIVEEFNARDVTAEHIDAYTPINERLAVLSRHESGETKIISNCEILTKGFDSPNSTCLIYARSTKSVMLHIQCIGRVLRKSDCGKDAIILDHGKNIQRLGFPTDPLPEYLDTGEGVKPEPVERKEGLPKPCPKCFHLTTKFPCEKCGFLPEKNHNVEVQDGELKKLEKVDIKEKIKFFAMLKGYAAEKGYKPGWAYWKAKEKFGVAPTRTKVTPAMKPNQEVLNWIKHLNIKAHYSKHKRATK